MLCVQFKLFLLNEIIRLSVIRFAATVERAVCIPACSACCASLAC